jgi:probable O-glycosylation ligase (exosortase A-associated)
MKGLIFTYLLSYGGAAAALFNPFVGLLIYVCFAIIRPEYLWYWSVPQGGSYSRVVAIGLLVGWVMHGLGNWRLGRATAIVYAFVGFMFWCVLSSLQAIDPELSQVFLEKLAKILLPFLVGITVIDSRRKLEQLAWVITLSQGYIAFELNLGYLGGGRFLVDFRESGFGSMDNNGVSIAMATGAGFSLYLGYGSSRWWQKLLAFACVLLMIHTILFAFSRGGMNALIISAIVAFWLLPKRPVHYLAFALMVMVGIRLAGPEVQSRFMTSFVSEEKLDSSAHSRLELWGNCIDVMKKRPVLGLGPENWRRIAHEYGWAEGKEAHSLWLELGAEIGVIGILLLISFYCICAFRLWRLTRVSEGTDPWMTNAARMVITALVGFMISAQFVSLKFLELPYYVVLFGAGVLKLTSVAPVTSSISQRLT